VLTGFPYREVALAEATGVAQSQFRQARKNALQRGRDWEVEDRAVWYSATGFYAVLFELRLGKKTADGFEPHAGVDLEALQKKAAGTATEEAPAIEMKKGRIERFLINRFYLGVRLVDGTLVQAYAGRIRDAYRKGLSIEVKPRGAGWEVATKPPRRPRSAV
jgi:hypothetical protein